MLLLLCQGMDVVHPTYIYTPFDLQLAGWPADSLKAHVICQAQVDELPPPSSPTGSKMAVFLRKMSLVGRFGTVCLLLFT